MFYKKAQAQIITVILIILLVLAAIVIVWQVVNSTIREGAAQIDKQSGCLGVTLEIEKQTATTFSIKRSGGGTITPAPTVKILSNGVTATCAPWIPVSPVWTDDFQSAVCTLSPAPTTVEAAIVLSDGTVCPITGKWKA
jgi:regulatory protein YycI of two-component signal transduction system YycFG